MKYGLTLVGKVRVFAKTKEIQGKNKKKYTVTDVWFNVSEKEEDGSFFNRSVNLIFKSGEPKPENNKVIEIQSARPMITGNGDYRKIAYFVESWTYESLEEGSTEISDDDTPF